MGRRALYAYVSGGMKDVTPFSVHPFEAGDFIVQSAADEAPPNMTEYAVSERLTDGVYHGTVDRRGRCRRADARARYCGKGEKNDRLRALRREQLFAFARATAARQKGEGGLVIALADGVSEAAALA